MKYKVILSYDGSSFIGWQKQSEGRSIQAVLEAVLSKIAKDDIRVHGSGRTDASVHALGQVFHFESNVNMDADAWFRGLSALVPKDIRIVSVQRVKDDFHAQYHAMAKTYEYRLNTGEYNPFKRNYVYQYNKPLDVDKMIEASKVFLGEHDFTSFNATELDIVSDQTRTITLFEIKKDEDEITFLLSGDGFLRYMVRMLVAACVEVGRGKLSTSDLERILIEKDKRAFARNIDACGLYLCSVTYDEGWDLDESI